MKILTIRIPSGYKKKSCACSQQSCASHSQRGRCTAPRPGPSVTAGRLSPPFLPVGIGWLHKDTDCPPRGRVVGAATFLENRIGFLLSHQGSGIISARIWVLVLRPEERNADLSGFRHRGGSVCGEGSAQRGSGLDLAWGGGFTRCEQVVEKAMRSCCI